VGYSTRTERAFTIDLRLDERGREITESEVQGATGGMKIEAIEGLRETKDSLM
jgi:hypothetical protein